SHPEDPNYVPPSKKRRDSREDTQRKESDDYDSQKYRHGEYASNERLRKFHCERDYRREHPSNSKDHQKRIEWASALKCDQLRKEELEGQLPSTADPEQMMDEPMTLQQAEVASEQQKPQRII
uniref:Uncharacterized protein n=1 Tax=Romanomermis culicivorax TaxID=13658 RepID=A0A915KVT7_ROMCU